MQLEWTSCYRHQLTGCTGIFAVSVMASAGTNLGPYEIVSSLGAGGMGEVYRARDTRLGREVAVKVLPRSYSENAERLARFQQEASAAGALNHPNILAIYDVGTQDGAPLPQRKAIDYALQI